MRRLSDMDIQQLGQDHQRLTRMACAMGPCHSARRCGRREATQASALALLVCCCSSTSLRRHMSAQAQALLHRHRGGFVAYLVPPIHPETLPWLLLLITAMQCSVLACGVPW